MVNQIVAQFEGRMPEAVASDLFIERQQLRVSVGAGRPVTGIDC
jgi:hypothetical protein